MIAKHDTFTDKIDIWSALAAPLPPGAITWRQDGRPISRDGRHVARFVAYVEANTVRERLESVVPGEWDLTIELLPALTGLDEDANQGPASFKARLQILGVIREDVGTGKDYKQAATDAFKRVAVRFGIAHELYSYEQNWVQMDGDGKYAKPIEDPAIAYARRYGGSATARPTGANSSPVPSALPQPSNGAGESDEPNGATTGPLPSDEVACPKCGGRTWDNRLTKRNPKAPDYKCRDRSCDGVVWPPKSNGSANAKPGRESADGPHQRDDLEEIPF